MIAIRTVLQQLSHGALDLVLPRHCAVCEQPMDAVERGVVCGRCWVRIEMLPHPQCARCGHPVPRGRPAAASCAWCRLLPAYVRAARSACWIVDGGVGAAVVHALKYEGWRAAAGGMADRVARLGWPPDVREERAAVVPVPLAPARERERGFNQSAEIARGLARAWGVPAWEDALVRTRATQTQTRLTPEERLVNVSGAFRASSTASARLRGAHIVVVDDVITTAATLNACAAALLAAGARIVSYATFGRAPSAGDRVQPRGA